MAEISRWITPFVKQCFITSGVAINVSQFGLVAAFVVAIVPQLQQPGSSIPMDVQTGSWFASIHGMTLIIGNILIVPLMSKYGRRVSYIISAGCMFVGWVCVTAADRLAWLMVGRVLQGISLGLILALGPIIIGECTSPRYRGSFLASITALISIVTALEHFAAFIWHWRTIALAIAIISFLNLLMSIYSPESPSWLASKGRYDDCRKVFRWYRGSNEEEELIKLIQASVEENNKGKEKSDSILQWIKNLKGYVEVMFMKKEVYKPLVIGTHLLILCYWCGLAVMSSYPNLVIHKVVGINADTAMILISLDIQRLITNTAATYIVKKFKRKTMLLTTVVLNSAAFFVIAGYVLAKERDVLPFDHPSIGIMLLHIHMFSVALGGLPLPMIIVGEIYPSEYRSLCSSITTTIASFNLFMVYKTFPETVEKLDISGSFAIYGVIITYCLAVTYYYLPETKDKTLLEIENEFKGQPERCRDECVEVFIKDNNKDEFM